MYSAVVNAISLERDVKVVIVDYEDTEKKRQVRKVFFSTDTGMSAKDIFEIYKTRFRLKFFFKTLKSDLDMRPVYHMTDDATKAQLNLAVLAYWVVSTTKYRLKQKGIKLRWEELLRIMSTQQRVTMVAQQANGHILKVRRSTTPETKLAEIQTTLGIPALPVCSIKSVWLQERPPEKTLPQNQAVSKPIAAMWANNTDFKELLFYGVRSVG